MVRMCWSKSLHLSAQLIGFACLIALFSQCSKANIDAIPRVQTLKKGKVYTDPVVQTFPNNLTPIDAVKNSYHDTMNQFKTRVRPAKPSSYTVSVVEPIVQKELLNHPFQWQSTNQPVMMVALFNQVVEVDTVTNEIRNKEALVWLYTPPKGSTDPGKVIYQNGQTAVWNKTTSVFDLSPAKILDPAYYVWCVLAWDKQGINIIAASRELPIQIKL